MSNIGGFEIENGKLRWLEDKDASGVVIIPEGVTSIGNQAFYECSNLTSITIPEGVTSIGNEAFCRCSSLTNITIPKSVTSIGNQAFRGCYNLTSITIPDGVTSIGDEAFCGCSSLTSITIPEGVTSIGDSAFSNCAGLTSVNIPDSVTAIGRYTFYNCSSLKNIYISKNINSLYTHTFAGCSSLTSITIPDGVKRIGDYVFADCHNLINVNIPKSVEKFGVGAFYDCHKLALSSFDTTRRKFGNDMFGNSLPEGWISNVEDFYMRFTDYDLNKYILDKSVWDKLDFGLQAEIYYNRHSNELLKTYMKIVDNPDELGKALLIGITEDISIEECDLLAGFLSIFGETMELDEIVKQMFNALDSSSDGKKLLKDIRKNPIIMARIASDKTAVLNNYEQIVVDILKSEKKSTLLITDNLSEYYKLNLSSLPELKFIDGTKAPDYVLAYLLIVHSKLEDNAEKVVVVNAYENIGVCENVQKILDILDSKSLQKALLKIIEENIGKKTPSMKMYLVYPICRYGDDNIMNEFFKQAPKWQSNSTKKEAPQLSTLRKACLYSSCRAVIAFADKYGDLDEYARIRNTDAQTIRDTSLIDFGFDVSGKKNYDLGGTTIVVTLEKDLSLSLFDTKSGKTVKSIPKRGNDEALVNAATNDFDNIKTNIKNVIKNRYKLLFSDFLNGKEQSAGNWKKVYIENPLMRTVANVVVWQQENNTFILKDNKPIHVDESSYTISEAPILVAHPMEMTQDDILAWKTYFINNSLEQPFVQVCEPVISQEEVHEDRYSDIFIPDYCFQGKEKDGILIKKSRYYYTATLTLAGCTATIDGVGDNDIKIGKFMFEKYTRQVNHIVVCFDNAYIYGCIIGNNNVTVDRLKYLTLTQLTKYIDLATRYNNESAHATLIEYKNEHFSESDSNVDLTNANSISGDETI